MFKPVENSFITYKLNEPIKLFDQDITEISMRKPTARDMLGVGNPVLFKGYDPLDLDVDDTKAFKMVSRLSGIPVDVLGDLTTNDMLELVYALVPFFIPGLKMKPASGDPAPSNQPEQQ